MELIVDTSDNGHGTTQIIADCFWSAYYTVKHPRLHGDGLVFIFLSVVDANHSNLVTSFLDGCIFNKPLML